MARPTEYTNKILKKVEKYKLPIKIVVINKTYYGICN